MDIDPVEPRAPSSEPAQPLSGGQAMNAALTDIQADIQSQAAASRSIRNARKHYGGPNPADIIQQRIAATEASAPAKRHRTFSADSPTELDPAKRTKTGPPHHVFDFRFTRPAKRRSTTLDHLSKPKAFFCTAKIKSHGEDIIACLLLPYARVGYGSHNIQLPGPGAYSTERIGPKLIPKQK